MRRSKAKREIDKLLSNLESKVKEKKMLVWAVPVVRVLTFNDEDGNFSEERLADFLSNVKSLAYSAIDDIYQKGGSLAKKQDLEVLLSLTMNVIWEAVRDKWSVFTSEEGTKEESREEHEDH